LSTRRGTEDTTGKIFSVCRNLAGNPDRFVQLGMGWVLRELFLADREAVLTFIRRYRAGISREGLRYAMEKMPVATRKRLLAEHASANRSGPGQGRSSRRARTKTGLS
jgi:3-methyladenine DNA glycosylase AlkD